MREGVKDRKYLEYKGGRKVKRGKRRRDVRYEKVSFRNLMGESYLKE